MSADVFYAASKVGGFLLTPSTALVMALLAAVILQARPRSAPIARRLGIVSAAAMAAAGFTPIGEAMLASLERRFPELRLCAPNEPGSAPTGIVLLGGGLGAVTIEGEVRETLNESVERIRYAADLARAWPAIPVIVSGGQAFARAGAQSEAEGMRRLLLELGVAPERIVIEPRSRTTAENAREVAALTGRTGPHLLVTSAFHMPRAAATFQAAGVSIAPAPTDWRADDARPILAASVGANLGALDLATREVLGAMAYWASGRSRAMFASAKDFPVCVAAP